MAELCARYWYPLYAYVLRKGCEPEEAEGLARRLLAKGIGQALVPAMETAVIALSADIPAAPKKPAEDVPRTDND